MRLYNYDINARDEDSLINTRCKFHILSVLYAQAAFTSSIRKRDISQC